VPALVQLEGRYLELVRDALTAPAARERELFAPGLIDTLLAAPNEHRTPSGASQLWQLGRAGDVAAGVQRLKVRISDIGVGYGRTGG